MGGRAFVIAVAACAPSAKPTPGVVVDGAELVLTTPQGEVRRGDALVGQTLQIGSHEMRVDRVEVDRTAVGRVVLYHLTLAGDGSEVCAPDADDQRWALPWQDEHGALQLTCTSGAIGKCIRFGYPPARGALHQACIRMVRADYGGDGATATRNGTHIEFCDRDGIHRCDGAGDAIEAAWTQAGAWCVAYPRIAELVTLDQLAARYPALKVGPACTLATARAEPSVVLFERSR